MKNKTDTHKILIDLETLNRLNSKGCAACGGKFTLGETVVAAIGSWEGGRRYIHESEATFDAVTASYYERSCCDPLTTSSSG